MEVLEGMVEKITFHNADNLYTVVRVTPLRGSPQPVVTAVGRFLEPRVGTRYSMQGHWVEHREYGRQFSVELYEEMLPTTVHGIERFLGSGMIKGVREGTARRVVDFFGEETLRVIEEEPDRLADAGLKPKQIKSLVEGLAQHRELKHVVSFLSGYDLTPGLILRIYKHYGTGCIKVVKSNPYQLCEDVWGVGFKTADMVARRMGLPEDAPVRAQAGLVHTLREAQENGHVYLPRTELLQKAAEALNVPPPLVEAALQELQDSRRVIDDDGAVYQAQMYHLERKTVERIGDLLDLSPLPVPGPADLEDIQRTLFIRLAPLQQQCLRDALSSGIFIMTGGPGTGKTTTVRSLLWWCQKNRLKVRLAAPTGRAAKRLKEATGEHASTVHRLLEWSVQDNSFLKGPEDPLKVDVLILDEASMLDVFLFFSVLAALPPRARLVMVGDSDQLPSVGPGQVLADLIASGVVPAVQLRDIFRQEAGSYIIENSHRINQGAMPLMPRDATGDFFFVREQDPEAVAARIVDYASTRLAEKFDPLSEIQVLAPMYKGRCGIDRLNELLQERLNPHGPPIPGLSFRLGDKVMQLRNNYDKGAFNGDMGLIVDADPEARTFVVRFFGADEEQADTSYEFHESHELTLAYACSVHKSQGSEFAAVIMPVVTQHWVMLQRNLLYTAVSRARRLLVLVGQPKALAIAVGNDKVMRRYTGLARRLATVAGA